MTDDFTPFLRAVIESPDDDVIRLQAADWLQDNGEPDRAAFIRLQVELARYDRMAFADCPRCEAGPDYAHASDCPRSPNHALRRRERELLTPGRLLEWSGIGELFHWDGSAPAFRRGFVAEVTTSWADWAGGECRHCLGHGVVGIAPAGRACVRCRGTGRVWGCHAAVLAACPVANARDGLVRLTTWPDIHGFTPGLLMSEWLAGRWPGVRFELPRTGLPDHTVIVRASLGPLVPPPSPCP